MGNGVQPLGSNARQPLTSEHIHENGKVDGSAEANRGTSRNVDQETARPSTTNPSGSMLEQNLHRKASASEARSRSAEMTMKSSYVEATLRQRVETTGAPNKGTGASALNGLRLGWMKDGSEVTITHSLSPAGGHPSRMDAIAFARLTGADPTAVLQDREGKWHAVQTNQNFYGGLRAASDNPLRQVEGLAHFDQKKIAEIQNQIEQARNKGDFEGANRLQKQKAALIFGVQNEELNFIRSSSERVSNKININSGHSGGGMHGAEKAPNTNFDPTKKNAMEISQHELEDPKNAPAIIYHENSHAKDYGLTQHWVREYEKATGKKFVPGEKGDPAFTIWVNGQAPKRLSRADAELVSDVSANANGSSEAKAYVGTFITALKAGNPEAAAAQLRTYAAGMTSSPLKINRPTGGNVELELKRTLETEYRKMTKDQREQFDKVFQDLAKNYPNAWISKFNHATALK